MYDILHGKCFATAIHGMGDLGGLPPIPPQPPLPPHKPYKYSATAQEFTATPIHIPEPRVPGIKSPLYVDVCYYHQHCLDGTTSAVLLYPFCRPDTEFIPCWVDTPKRSAYKGKHVLVVDVTPVQEILEDMVSCAASVYVIDHHESAGPVLEKTLPQHCYLFDTENAACALVCQWLAATTGVYYHGFARGENMSITSPLSLPKSASPAALVVYLSPFVALVNSLDMFDWSAFGAGSHDAQTLSLTMEATLSTGMEDVRVAMARGQAYVKELRMHAPVVLRTISKQVDRCGTTVCIRRLKDFPDVLVAVVNTPMHINHVAFHLYSTLSVHVVWAWYYNERSGRVRVMLRSPQRFNCAAFSRIIAGSMGGGHPNAASFPMDTVAAMHALFE